MTRTHLTSATVLMSYIQFSHSVSCTTAEEEEVPHTEETTADILIIMERKYGVTAREGFASKTAAVVENISHNTTDFYNDKTRNDSVASTDSGIGDCDLEVDIETGLEVISLEEVSYHDTKEDGWLVIFDKVYQVTEYLMKHPGGEDVMMEYLGYDATLAFRGVGHSRGALRILERYLVGILPKGERLCMVQDM